MVVWPFGRLNFRSLGLYETQRKVNDLGGPKTLQERLPDIDLRSGMARAWAGSSLLGAEGPPGRGIGGREKVAKKHAQDLNTPMGRRPGEFCTNYVAATMTSLWQRMSHKASKGI